MKKISFYLDQMKDGIDYSNPWNVNPGIGGTPYLFWTLSYFIHKFSKKLDVYLFCEDCTRLPQDMNLRKASSMEEFILQSKKENIDFAIIRGPIIKKNILELIESVKLKTVVWSHNFENYISTKYLAKCEYVVKNVCVSKEQLELLLDTDLYRKSTYIFNGMCFDDYQDIKCPKNETKICYIGNLYPGSGYESVIKAWPKVEQTCPGAQLYIIGGNDLYLKSKIKGLCSNKSFSNLEKLIHKNLYNGENVKNNVHFLGVMGGKEKLLEMGSSAIGIANLTYSGETFGLSAVEFEALSVPVISVNKYGIRDTVDNNNTGILVDSHEKLSDAIALLFHDENLREALAKHSFNFVDSKFNYLTIVHEWEKMFENIYESNCAIQKERYNYDGKKMILLIYKFKKYFKYIPSHLFYKYLSYYFKRIFQKLNLI